MTRTIRPRYVGPSPKVLKSIQAEIKKRKLTTRDLRMASVVSSLVAEPTHSPGFNEGIFYPESALPRRAAGVSPSRAMSSRPTTGRLRCLVLLVDFADNRGTRPAQEFRDMLFSQGTYPTGSLRDFYKENSYGQLDVDGEVIGWLRLPEKYNYYVNGDNGGGHYPTNAQRMVEDALAMAAQQVDFSQFDTDGDGYIDGLFVVHAGDGAEADPNPTSRAKKIWSHQWNLSKPFVSHGKTAYAYCTEPEDGRAGVFCHEFGHMLGLPDLYDTTYHSEGVGQWCVMGAGSWNNGGLTPGHFSAWAKARLGWIKPKNVKKAATVTLNAIEQNKTEVYRLWTKGASGTEYFLIENRQRVGFDKYLPASGLLIWHIDDSEHNNDHPGDYWVGLRQADGKLNLENNQNQGDGGDPYPGTSKNKTFDSKSNPNSNDQFSKPTGVAITTIAMKQATVTCKVKV